MVETHRCHGVLVTFRRPRELADHLDRLSAQTRPLDTLLVVDNDADESIRRLVLDRSGEPRPAAAVRYLGLEGNPGPAGAIAAGIDEVLAFADPDDLLILLDDDDPPPHADTLAAIGSVRRELAATHPDVGGVGLWGAVLGRSGRLRAATATHPEVVDYLPGGACPHYTIEALRAAGGPDADLFFGFDDLDLGLALQRSGWRLWSSGLARDHGWTSMVEGRRAKATVEAPTWRRYYSLRNLVVVLRRDRRHLAALSMSFGSGLAKPIANLVVHPRVAGANLRLNATALRDGWRSRLGKTIDPAAESPAARP